MSAGLASAVYEGVVRHRRHAPRPHEFCYRMAQLYLDLDELDQIFKGRWLWSVGRRNLAQFRRSDFLGPSGTPLAVAVRDRVAETIGTRPAGPIRVLTHLCYAGHSFNPVTFYYCFGTDGQTLEFVVAEITNTPWHERHAYVLPVGSAQSRGRAWHWTFDKCFHVSPFMPMDCLYQWQLTAPDRTLAIHMAVVRDGTRQFDAALALRRRPLDAAALRRVLLRYPLMTTQVVTGIYWQALRLWLKGVPIQEHPRSSQRTST